MYRLRCSDLDLIKQSSSSVFVASLRLSLSPSPPHQVEQLSAQLKEKADCCSELLLGSEQLRRELGERDEEIEKLESRIRELEQALLASTESQEKVRRRGRGR